MPSERSDYMEKENSTENMDKEITIKSILDIALPQSALNGANSAATNNGCWVKNVSEINDSVNGRNNGGINETVATNKRKFSTSVEEEENKENGGKEPLNKNNRNNIESSDAQHNSNEKKSKVDENLIANQDSDSNKNKNSIQQMSGTTDKSNTNTVTVPTILPEIKIKREEVETDDSFIENKTDNTNNSTEQEKVIDVKVEPTSADESETSAQQSSNADKNVCVPKPLLEDVKPIKTEAGNNDADASSSHFNNDNGVPLTSTVKVEKAEASSTTRQSCRYGISCYRQNIIHRQQEAHPGDVDYTRPNYPPPPNGGIPCPYGHSCYRRNPYHFYVYTHPPSTDFHENYRNHRNEQPFPHISSSIYNDGTDSENDFSDSGSEYLECDEISSTSDLMDYDDCDRAEE